ncbi:MAG TPA: magnesium transporter [Phycisphaerales bacterium]|nr:magnesium transporter [Phycisphaerales bacterium]HMP36143.1 magnesium transporter [Phycisphaerales bacterium]
MTLPERPTSSSERSIGAENPGGALESIIEDPTIDSPEDRRVAELLARESDVLDVPGLAQAVEAQEPADAAATLEGLGDEEAAEVIEEMDERAAAEALAHMQVPLAVSVVEDLVDEDAAYAAKLVGLMASDDAADLVQALPEEYAAKVLAAMAPDQALRLRRLMKYDERTAGGMMSTEYLAVYAGMTVAQATERIRSTDAPEDATHVFVTDAAHRLVGLLSLRALLLARAEERIESIMDREVDAIQPTLDREEVAEEFARYDYSVLPVVDPQRRLLGVVTVDDVIDIIRAEQTEDAQRMVGAGAEEAVYSPIPVKLRGRLPWLCVNLFTSSMAAVVVLRFEGLIAELAILAVLMPVIANQAGNAGQQSLAVTLRGIVLDQVRTGRVPQLLLRETAVGFINGTIAGIIVGTVVAIFELFTGAASWRLGLVAGLAMSGALTLGTFTGASLPLLMRRLGYDPATASTIFLTMVTDTASFLVFLGLASMLWRWLV